MYLLTNFLVTPSAGPNLLENLYDLIILPESMCCFSSLFRFLLFQPSYPQQEHFKIKVLSELHRVHFGFKPCLFINVMVFVFGVSGSVPLLSALVCSSILFSKFVVLVFRSLSNLLAYVFFLFGHFLGFYL